jgi:glycosyltransferase involved in cell wall biosynthesis
MGSERINATATGAMQAIDHEAARFIDGPRVSIIVRTYDRPALLARAIASIADQSYKNVEIVVVNNGGDDVRAIVESAAAGRPFRYEVMPERKHISAASNVGARAATGEFVGYLDDDDLLYGDHCARTADVLTRTGAELVFTVCVGEYAKMHGDEKHVLGYQIYLDRQYHPDDIYVSNMSPIHSIVHQRAIFERIGYFDETLPVTDDWELWLRLASSGARFVRIERATCEYSWRYDPTRGNMTVDHQMDFVRAFDSITDRYAKDVANRPSIRASQANARAGQAQRAQDAADPEKRASIVIGSMSSAVVPVAPDWERRSER